MKPLPEHLPIWQEAVLLLTCVWASCRFYYFLCHVLHSYVDPELKSAGLIDLAVRLRKKRSDKEPKRR